ncbi:MAG TPA: protein-L-isoaspartate O-methyltransferase, partial [SAR324 cluster bacterium]|nr:protein-L-isoaspartate O-methyltransferase [SAR324 cluster bacterium]
MAVLFQKKVTPQVNELQKHKQSLYRYWKNSRMITSERILDAFMEVPRELFIETSFGDQAYADHPLPIGEGQTISQPTTVMLMLQLLELFPGQRVLEVGAGCGYNAALLAQLASHVITIERHEKLAELAHRNLKKIGT